MPTLVWIRRPKSCGNGAAGGSDQSGRKSAAAAAAAAAPAPAAAAAVPDPVVSDSASAAILDPAASPGSALPAASLKRNTAGVDARQQKKRQINPAGAARAAEKRTEATSESDLPTGVYQTSSGRFEARTTWGGKEHCIGTFATPEQASGAYIYASAKEEGFGGKGRRKHEPVAIACAREHCQRQARYQSPMNSTCIELLCYWCVKEEKSTLELRNIQVECNVCSPNEVNVYKASGNRRRFKSGIGAAGGDGARRAAVALAVPDPVVSAAPAASAVTTSVPAASSGSGGAALPAVSAKRHAGGGRTKSKRKKSHVAEATSPSRKKSKAKSERDLPTCVDRTSPGKFQARMKKAAAATVSDPVVASATHLSKMNDERKSSKYRPICSRDGCTKLVYQTKLCKHHLAVKKDAADRKKLQEDHERKMRLLWPALATSTPSPPSNSSPPPPSPPPTRKADAVHDAPPIIPAISSNQYAGGGNKKKKGKMN